MIVVDTSVIVDLVIVPTSLTPPDPTEEWWAPTIIDAEFIHVLLRHRRNGALSEVAAQRCLDDFAALAPKRWQLDDGLRRRMLTLGHRLSAYDAAFVAVAEVLDAPLYTRDRRLAATASDVVECHVV
jgi:predicted nucleic acid-binding protein